MVEKMTYYILVKDKEIVDGVTSSLHPTVIWNEIKDLLNNYVWGFAEINVDFWPQGIAVGEERVVGGEEPSKKMELFTSNELESIFRDILVWSDTDIRGWNSLISKYEVNWSNWDIKLEIYWDWKVTTTETKVIERIASKFESTEIGYAEP